MTAPRPLSLGLALAATAAAGFGIGTVMTAPPARATGTHHVYTLRVGDRVRVPAIKQICSVAAEGRTPNLICARRRYHHQLVIFGNDILVYKAGHPDHPVWSGKP